MQISHPNLLNVFCKWNDRILMNTLPLPFPIQSSEKPTTTSIYLNIFFKFIYISYIYSLFFLCMKIQETTEETNKKNKQNIKIYTTVKKIKKIWPIKYVVLVRIICSVRPHHWHRIRNRASKLFWKIVPAKRCRPIHIVMEQYWTVTIMRIYRMHMVMITNIIMMMLMMMMTVNPSYQKGHKVGVMSEPLWLTTAHCAKSRGMVLINLQTKTKNTNQFVYFKFFNQKQTNINLEILNLIISYLICVQLNISLLTMW